ncbi:Ger(x)C family germination protein [Paenibacillus taihuensis]|uniref:Ger(X)C family germination protein n=1 Tax=Paenibacillus taihuensis TaxID=1156355 RepID=A0A3D9RL05_9BACL|nr:Ger(x)C family spore germination protein [Paenibacillus taihuensis]REE80228.1 Ger(x)C family germination protein [Paenibacillus taihuensis]
MAAAVEISRKAEPAVRASRRELLLLLTLVLSSVLLSGCKGRADTSDLSAQAFVKAMGIDYEKGQYVVTVQLMDFSAIAKTETPKSQKPSVWIGIGRGKSISEANKQIAVTTQSRLNFDQLSVVIVREPAMDKMAQILDAVNRVRVTRYTSWIYGTRDDLSDIFTASAFFELSQTYSYIYNPLTLEKQNSSVPPLTMQKFVTAFNEKAMTALLPSVSVSSKVWRENKRPIMVQELDGVFAFKLKRKPVYLPLKQVIGVRWSKNPLYHAQYTVQAEGHQDAASVWITYSKVKKKEVKTSKGGPKFVLHVKAYGDLIEIGGNLTVAEIESKVRKLIEDEIMLAYTSGIRKHIDLFNLEEIMYRYHLGEWKKTARNGDWHPGENDLKVELSFGIRRAGVFEMQ